MAVTVTGVDEVIRLMQQVDRVSQTVVTKSAKAGAKIVLDDVKAHVPVDTRLMKKSLKMKAERRKQGKKVYDIKFVGDGLAKIGKNGNRSFYPMSQEYGWVKADGTKEPGKRFLRNGIDNNRDVVKQTVINGLIDGLGGVR